MRGFESEFAAWIDRQFKRDTDIQRIETNMTGGIPDLNMCRAGVEIWAELKVITQGRVLLRKEQYAWGLRRAMHSGRVFVLAYHPEQDTILAWQFPNINVEPYSKYLWIKNAWGRIFYRKNNVDDLKSFLFTPETTSVKVTA